MIFFQIVFVLSLLGLSYVAGTISWEKKLWDDLNTNMGTFIPSVKGAINVSVRVPIVSMSDYDHMLGTMRVGYWLQLLWSNPYTKWNPRDYGGLDTIHIPSSMMWVPDLVPYLHTSAEPAFEARVVIRNTGDIIWVPHMFATILCGDVRDGPRYPRDEKICQLKIGSWVYDQSKLNLTITPEATLPEFSLTTAPLESSGWEFKGVSEKLQGKQYPCCPETYQSLRINITIKRKDTYFGLAVSVPGVVGGLTVALLYLVPPSSPARLISQMICLLILVFIGVTDIRLMGSTVMMAPAAHYFMAAMVLDLFAIFWSVFTSAAWLHGSAKASGGRGAIDSLLSKLECICCLPSGAVDQDHLHLQMDDKAEGDSRSRIFGLSSGQRLILVLDRLFCIINFVLLLFLFIYLGA